MGRHVAELLSFWRLAGCVFTRQPRGTILPVTHLLQDPENRHAKSTWP